ncbi:MAG: MarR family transcriptional regulator [Candidatus Omnitrophota bacterium]
MSILREVGIKDAGDRLNDELVYCIGRAYLTIEAHIAHGLASHALSSAKFNILMMVKHAGKGAGISQNELSRLLLVTTSNTTRMIDRLEREGLIARSSHPRDRRVKVITVTRKGSSVLDAAWPAYMQVVDELFGRHLSAAEKKKVIALLARLLAGIGGADK